MTFVFLLIAVIFKDTVAVHRETKVYDAMNRRSGAHMRKGGRA